MRAKGTAYWHEELRKCWLLYLFLSSFLIAIISYYYVKKNYCSVSYFYHWIYAWYTAELQQISFFPFWGLVSGSLYSNCGPRTESLQGVHEARLWHMLGGMDKGEEIEGDDLGVHLL